ncbi:RHS repeat-associated core domain-containing protein [Stenotrophomonas sp. 364]|uniref:RHS repeat-associated core domain-containing protein n=1 Tax=Stenotrophomonas sp. 364 TaxID=2691571 RepID=UPI001315D2C2|nr:RHS repeat-associated core domain-containing protein [Stenotrophomonas sp. 364]QHB73653.1 type IV secretion protein Rhs [Stenotrophomonas sp. 364]
MSIAAKHFDPQLGIDIHMYAMPPCPLPTPHIGLVLDPFDYIPFIGSTIKVNGVHRGTAGTGGLDIHIPLGVWGPPLAAPMGPQFDGEEIFMGSRTVSADGEPFSRLAMPVLDCNLAGMINPFRVKKPKKPLRAMSLPTGLNVAIPTSVKVGGPPTVSWTAMAFRAAFAGLGKLRKTDFFRKKMDAFAAWRRGKWGHLPSGTLKCRILRAEPVDIRDGSVSVSHEDFSIPGRLPLSWRRVYASRHAQRTGACGYGWQTPADIALALSADGSAWLSGPDEVAFFPELPRRDGMDAATLDFVDCARLWRENGQWIVRFKGGLQYHFDATPAAGVAVLPHERSLPIERIEDRCGNHWRFERRDGHLVRIVESGVDGLQGRFIEVDARQGHIDRLQLHDPASGLNHLLVSYRYANGDLIAAVDPLDAPRTFGYQQHYMVRHTDRVGLSFYYAFDAQWRVVHSWGDGGLYDYHFDYDALLHETRITDSLGHVSLVKFDENRLPLCEIDPLDGVTIFEYDDFGRTVAVTDPEGLRTGFEYDERGNLVVLVRADGTTLQQQFDDNDQLLAVTDPDGNTWQQHYDARGLLIEQTDPLQASTRYAYDAHGLLQAQTNARGAVIGVAYDRHGLVALVRDPLGHESRFEHDPLGRLLRQVDPLGQPTTYTYDVKGRLLAVLATDGTGVRCEYDAEDQLITYLDEAGARTRLQYVGIGQIGKRLQADGQVVEYRYDTEEQLVAVINQRGETYTLTRDPLGRIVEEVDYWGQPRRYEYDAAGRLTATLDPLGQRIGFATDKMGRITAKTLPDIRQPGRQVKETFEYDKRGQLIALRNPHRYATRRFDPLGQLLEELQDGFRVGYAYDEVGNRIQRQTGAGNTVAFAYDLRDQLIEVGINDEAPITLERDALGRTTREQLSAHVERRFEYDARNLLTAQTVLRDASPLFDTRYDYDRTGNLTRRQDSAQGVDEYRYDAIGRLLAHTDPKGVLHPYYNDPAGDRLRTEIREVRMRKVAGGDEQAELLWTREGTYQGVHYVFDRAGDMVRKGSQGGGDASDLELIWDANHRLAESRRGGKSTHYGYDPLGRRVFKRNPDETTWFFWDGDALLGEVKQANDAEDAAPVWVDNVASLIEVKRRQRRLGKLHEGVREYVYYPGSFVPLSLIAGDTAQAAEVKPVYQAAQDGGGTVSNGSATPSLPKMEAPEHVTRTSADDPKRKQHANQENTTGLGSLGVTALGSGAANRQKLVGEHQAGSPSIGLEQLGGIGLGQKVSTASIASKTVHSTVLAQPDHGVREGSGSAELLNGRAVENALIAGSSNTREAPTGGGVYYFHLMPNGCPERILSASGAIVWEGCVGAWGAVESTPASNTENNLRLQGQYFDCETGLHYNRNRYFDPGAGQFIGQDPLRLDAGENLYEFAVNTNSWTDPLGLSCRTTRKLQSFVDQAVREITENPQMAKSLMSKGSYSHLENATSLYSASFGKAVERRVAQLVQGDKNLRNTIKHTGLARGANGQFISSPDFTKNIGKPKVWDVTTNAGVPAHAARYGDEKVTYLVYDVVHGLNF